jgi:anti-sigma-K factor RskA
VTDTCADCRSLLGGYVLHALEPGEAEAVRRHLATCEACATEHGQLTALPALLDVAGGVERQAEQPPAALEEAVLDRFAREAPGTPEATPRPGETEGVANDARPAAPRRLRRRLRRAFARPIPAAITGAVAAAAVTAALITLPGDNEAEGNVYKASLAGTSAIPGATAKADLTVFSSGTHVKLSVRGLRGQPDSVYELWCLRDDGGKVSAGTFRTDATGRADVALTTAAVPGEYHRLSVERKGFSTSSASGERVMAGEIEYPDW